jgi:amino acid adenylation domain-containing protein/non-ribosomal peptide synthase protein (TIGR01720 family)
MVVNGYRLSPQQRRLWSLGGPAPFAAQRIVRLDGRLDVPGLRAALAGAVAGHEALRTRFVAAPGGEPLQVIDAEPRYDWAPLDLASVPGDARMQALRDHLRAVGVPDPARGPVVRATLASITDGPDGTHLLGLSLPALCADSAGLRLVAQHVLARSIGGAHAAAAPVSVLAFAAWQNELLDRGADGSPGAAFWAERRPSADAAVILPLERRSAPGFTPATAPVVRLDRTATAALVDAAGEGGELEAIVLAAWCALVARLTGRTELDVAVVGDGRQTPELASIVGLLARWLPVRARALPDTSIPALARELAAHQRAAREWQRYFVWPIAPAAPLEGRDFPSIAFRWDEPDATDEPDRVIFDRSKACLHARRVGDTLALDLAYDAGALPTAAVSQLCAQLGHVVRQLSERPALAIGELALGAPSHQRWLAGSRRAAAARLVHRAFEAQALRHADRPAVAFEGQVLRYAGLDARANQLAHALRRRGVGPEVRVGLCLERSLEMIVGILGVLKAGGAYVPLDPDQPAQRLALLIEDLQAPVVVASRAVIARGRLAGVPVIEADGDALAHEPTTPPAGDDDPAHAAYVLFTSGSTGRPKGVVIEHRQLASYVASVIAACDLPEHASYATVSTFAADLGNTVVFPALVTGSCLHVVSADRASDPAALAAYLARHPIDCLKIVPSHLEALLSGASPAALLPRQRLILGGESSALPWVRELARAVPGCTIYNHYGPTETTVGVLTFRFDPARPLAATQTMPLETVVHDTAVYILDAALRPVPPGVTGDVHIGGAAVGRGYLGRPDLTAEAFIPDPRGAPGARMYRTGDRGRVLEDGTFEFLGRADHQVKFHGHRLELAELRLAINQHPQIRNSVVRLTRDGAGNAVLAAYYVARQPVDHDELRRFLKDRVIEEVLPNLYVHLTKLPLTLNGKIHFDALPSIEEARQRARRTMVAPRTPAEQILARIWCDVLHLTAVSVEDNFFSLGGDSILAILVVSRANQARLRMTPRQVFQHQSIAELARVAVASAEARDAGPVEGELPMLPIQRWFLARTDPATLDAAAFVAWLEVRRPLDPAVVEQALAALWRHHDALRLRVVHEADGFRASIDGPAGAPGLLRRVALDGEPLAAAHRRVEQALRAAIRLGDGHAVAAAWLDLGPARPARLAIAVHRLAVDAVSWRILAEQLDLACDQLAQGACELPPRTTSVKAWAERLAAHATSAELRDELAHWTNEAWQATAALPRDRDAAPDALDLIVERSLDAATTAALLDDAPARLRCELDELLIAALGEALCSWAGGPVVIDVERHGRDAPFDDVDLSRTVGWLTAVHPVRLASDGGVAGVRAIKEQLRAVPGHGLGHGVLRSLAGDPETRRRVDAAASAALVFRYTGQHRDAEARTFRPLDGDVQAMTPQHALAVIARVVDRPGPVAGRDDPGGDAALRGITRHVDITWLASAAVYDRATIERLAARLTAILAGFATGDAAQTAVAPSDFPLSGLDQANLDKLLARLK